MKTVWSGLLLAALLALGGCTTPVKGLYSDPSFTYRRAAVEGIGVGGVVSIMRPLLDAERTLYGDVLLRGLRDERPGLRWQPAGRVVEAVGAAHYGAMLDYYRRYGLLRQADVDELRLNLRHVRYLALARIESNRVSEQQRQDEQTLEAEGERPEQVRVTLSFESRRELAVALTVYDLQSGHPVWNGAVRKSATNSQDHSRTYRAEARWVQGLAEHLLRELLGGRNRADLYPVPPTTLELLERVARGFGENLPENDG